MKHYSGIIIFAIPYINSYMVAVDDKDVVKAHASSHSSLTSIGTQQIPAYGPGTPVVLEKDGWGEYVIVYAAPRDVLKSGAPFIPFEMVPGSGVGYIGDIIRDFLLGKDLDDEGNIDPDIINKVPFYNADRNYGRALDLLPGEWALYNAFAGHFLFSDLQASLKMSDQARLDMFFLDNYVRMTALRHTLQNKFYARRMFQDRTLYNIVEQLAHSVREGMGSYEGPAIKHIPLKEGAGRLFDLKDPAQTGIFRTMRIQGGLVDGTWETLTMPASTCGNP